MPTLFALTGSGPFDRATINVEAEYRRRIESMPPHERVACGAAMFAMVRQSIARRIVAERGNMGDMELKWHVAMELYGDENQVLRRLIQEQIDAATPSAGPNE